MLRMRYVRLAVMILLAGILISSYWTLIIDEKIAVVCIVFLCVTVLLEEIRFHDKKDEQNRKFTVQVIPFLLAGMIVLYVLPASEEPYDWALARRIINKIGDDITHFVQLFESDSINGIESSLGFAEEAQISGNVKDNKDEMMTLILGSGAPDRIYLDGKYFEDFDGRNWNEAAEAYPYMMDTIESYCALSMIETALTHDYGRIVKAEITYTGQNTQYVFAPVKSFASDLLNSISISGFSNELLFDKKRGNNTEYNISYLVLNQNSNIVPFIIENGKMIDENIWNAERVTLGLKEDLYSYEEFTAYRNRIYGTELCPNAIGKEELSKEVRAFLDNAVFGAETDYEKLIALERAFSDFEYTLTPGTLPRKVETPSDFLDYFLLEAKKGYCNSFATAFVLLCRAEGIPARYVHGYYVPINDSSYVTVYSNMAHAYPEAYIEGIGWTVFEPTPGYSARVAWDEKGRYEISDYLGKIGFSYEPDTEKAAVKTETEAGGVGLKWYMIVIPIAFCLLVLTVIIFFERIINIRHFNRMNQEEKAYTICSRIMNILKYRGFVRDNSETVHEYTLRVSEESGIVLTGFSEYFEKVLYSPGLITEEDLTALKGEYTLITESLKGKEKLWYFFMSIMGLS